MDKIIDLKTIFSLARNEIPKQLVVQITNFCNAKCPQCSMRKDADIERKSLTSSDIRSIIEEASKKEFKSISFTGGEPFMFDKNLIEYLKEASNSKIEYIRTGTNGFMFMNSENPDFEYKIENIAEEISKTRIRNFWISLDSADPAVHEKMRGLKGVVKGIEKALPIFHRHGIYPSANLGINWNIGKEIDRRRKKPENEEMYNYFLKSFRDFYQFTIDLGFTMVNSCYPMSADKEKFASPSYGAISDDSIVVFSDKQKSLLYKALYNVIPEYRNKIRIFSPLVSLYSMQKFYEGDTDFSYPCRGGKDFFFIGKDGEMYPCGYLGDKKIGKIESVDFKKIKQENCKKCDWECFRDPTELISPFTDIFKDPISLWNKFSENKEYYKIWRNDLKYYKACDYFDGRVNIDFDRLNEYK